MEKTDKTRIACAISLAAMIIITGAAFIGETASLYYGAIAIDPVSPPYTVDSVRQHLLLPMILLAVTVAAAIAVYVFNAVRPAAEKKKSVKDSSDVYNNLKKRVPLGGYGDEYVLARHKIDVYGKFKFAAWCVALAVCVAGAIFIIVYVANPSHYHTASEELHADVLGLVQNVITFIAAGVIACFGAAIIEILSAKSALPYAKIAIKTGDRRAAKLGDIGAAAKIHGVIVKAKSSTAIEKYSTWIVRAAVFCVAIGFIIAGALNGGAGDVLVKAINLCMECVGLG